MQWWKTLRYNGSTHKQEAVLSEVDRLTVYRVRVAFPPNVRCARPAFKTTVSNSGKTWTGKMNCTFHLRGVATLFKQYVLLVCIRCGFYLLETNTGFRLEIFLNNFLNGVKRWPSCNNGQRAINFPRNMRAQQKEARFVTNRWRRHSEDCDEFETWLASAISCADEYQTGRLCVSTGNADPLHPAPRQLRIAETWTVQSSSWLHQILNFKSFTCMLRFCCSDSRHEIKTVSE